MLSNVFVPVRKLKWLRPSLLKSKQITMESQRAAKLLHTTQSSTKGATWFFFSRLLTPHPHNWAKIWARWSDSKNLQVCSAAAHLHWTWCSSAVKSFHEVTWGPFPYRPHLLLLFFFLDFPCFNRFIELLLWIQHEKIAPVYFETPARTFQIYTLKQKVCGLSSTNRSPPICSPQDWVCNTAVCLFYTVVRFTALYSHKNMSFIILWAPLWRSWEARAFQAYTHNLKPPYAVLISCFLISHIGGFHLIIVFNDNNKTEPWTTLNCLGKTFQPNI